MNYVKITKIAAVENPRHETAKPEEYFYGEDNVLSPPVEYWITGKLLREPVVGEDISAIRDSRNGVKIGGFFTSSIIVKIEGNKYYTLNSVYQIEEINKK